MIAHCPSSITQVRSTLPYMTAVAREVLRLYPSPSPNQTLALALTKPYP